MEKFEKAYLIEQCEAFVLNKLANEPADKEELEASFVLNSDQYFFYGDSLQYLLDKMVSQGTISIDNESGKDKYVLGNFDDLPLFSFVNYTPFQLSANFGVPVYNSFDEIASNNGLIKDKNGYGIYFGDYEEQKKEVIDIEVPTLREIDPLIRTESKKDKKERKRSQSNNKKDRSQQDEVSKESSVSEEIVQEKPDTAEPIKEEEPVSTPIKEVFDKPVSIVQVIEESKSQKEQDALSLLGMLDDPDKEKIEEPVVQEDSTLTSKSILESQEFLATQLDDGAPKSDAYSEFKTYISQMDAYYKYTFESLLKDILPDRPHDKVAVLEEPNEPIMVESYTELKNHMSKKGYVVKPYVNQNAYSYYADNFYFINRITRDVSLIIFALLIAEIFIGYICFDKYVDKGIWFYVILAAISCIVPAFLFARYCFFKYKRHKASFNFRISFATAFMVYINLMVILVLFAFTVPSLKVTTSDVNTLILPIFFPAVLLFNIPLSVCIFAILYSTKRYHIH